MKKIILFFLAIFPVFSCNGQDNLNNPFVFIGQKKITLRYSTKNDVEKLLGYPEKIDFFPAGGEGFDWKNFTVCSYGGDKLRFHYGQDGKVIRISANAEYFGEVRFLEKDIKLLTKKDILNLIKNLGEDDYYSEDNFIMYDYKLTPEVQIDYGFWFDNTGKIRWIDIYYPSSW